MLTINEEWNQKYNHFKKESSKLAPYYQEAVEYLLRKKCIEAGNIGLTSIDIDSAEFNKELHTKTLECQRHFISLESNFRLHQKEEKTSQLKKLLDLTLNYNVNSIYYSKKVKNTEDECLLFNSLLKKYHYTYDDLNKVVLDLEIINKIEERDEITKCYYLSSCIANICKRNNVSYCEYDDDESPKKVSLSLN